MSIGFWQILLILAVILVLFGAGKIPKAMGDLGRGLRAFKKGLQGGEDEAPTPKKKATKRVAAPRKPKK